MESFFSAVAFGATALSATIWKKRLQYNHEGKWLNNSDSRTIPVLRSMYSSVSSSSASMQSSSSSRLVRHLSAHSTWCDYSDTEEIFIQDFPKVELHVHLDGSFDADFLWKYMRQNPESIYCLPVKINPPWDSKRNLYIRQNVVNCETSKDFHNLCTCRGYRSLSEMLNCFEVFLPLVRGNIQLIEELAYDFCQRQWEQNVVYCEVRYSPHLLAEGFTDNISDKDRDMSKGFEKLAITPQAVFHAVTRGLRRGCSQYINLTVNQILCAITWRPDWAASTLNIATKHQYDFPCAVVGVDIAAGEEHFDDQNHPELYGPHYAMAQEAKKRHIPLTLHAGEMTTVNAVDNVRKAIIEYGACRLGHGYRMTESSTVMDIVRSHNVHVEVCPTSSVETGGWVYDDETSHRPWKNHPATTMLKHGISISFSSDDPAVFHTSLSWQYRIALAKMSLSRRDIVQMNLNAVDASWCPKEEKERLTKLIQCYGQRYGIDECRGFQCLNNVQMSHSSWWKSKTDIFSDRVYLFNNVKM